MLTFLFLSTALAETPTPDRPTFARSGGLVADNTLELELGLQWDQYNRTAPVLLKYSIAGIVEPRLGADLSGFDTGSPALSVGVKIRLLRTDEVAFSVYVDSAIPVTGSEVWSANTAALFAWGNDGWFVTGNATVQLTEPIISLGTISVAALGGRQLTPAFSVAIEAATALTQGRITQVVTDVSLGWSLTDSLVFDGAVGWDIVNYSPYVAAGLTVNFGSFKAMN